MWKSNKAMNGVKSHWRRMSKPAPLKQWAKHMRKEKGDVGVLCGRWLDNKRAPEPDISRH